MSDIAAKHAERWERFRSDPDYARVINELHHVVDAAGLDTSDLGTTWGVTVHVDGEMFLRLNCADYSLFDIRDPARALDERRVCLAIKRDGMNAGFLARATAKLTGVGAATGGGFKNVPGSETVWVRFADLPTLMWRSDIRQGLRRHVEARPHKLFSPNRHNPYSSELFS